MSKTQINFLKRVCKPELQKETIEIRFQNKNGNMKSFFSNDFDIIEMRIEEQRLNKNVFFGIAPRKDNSSGKKENCSTTSTLLVDVDCGIEGHKKENRFQTKQEALEYIKQMPIRPSLILDSGHGLHCYFLLQEKLPLDEQNIQLVEKLNKALSYMFGGDPSCSNVDRILRIPETLNMKTDSIIEVKIIQEDSGIKYSISELLDNPLIRIDWDKLNKLKIKNIPALELLYGKGIDLLEKACVGFIQFLLTNHLC